MVPTTDCSGILPQAGNRRRSVLTPGAELQGQRPSPGRIGKEIQQDYRSDIDPILLAEELGAAAEERQCGSNKAERGRLWV